MTPGRAVGVCILAYGVLNSVLYSGLLPLWDGFDEPFHYSYVRTLAETHRPPTVRSTMPPDVWRSLPLAPASHIVKRNITSVVTFDEYFRLAPQARQGLRTSLMQIHADATGASGSQNYEAQQAPLAYVFMGVVDAGRSRVPLVYRVLLLRILFGSLSVLLTGALAWRLADLLGLPDALRNSLLFVLFSSQVFFASTAHVSNDWLTVPMFSLVLLVSLRAYLKPCARNVALLGLVLGLAILTKASLLALVPFALGIALWRRHPAPLLATCLLIAGPWYVRNWILFRNLSAMQETAGGAPVWEVLRAALHVPWIKTISTAAVSSIWIGNNSATTFGLKTVLAALGLLAVALGMFVVAALRRTPPASERILIAGCLAYVCGLAYYAAASYRYTGGAGITIAPWYIQPLEPALLCLCFLGILRAGTLGRLIAIAMTWLWAYVMIATYVVKLIPFYSGHVVEHSRLGDLVLYYSGSLSTLLANLATTALFAPGLVLWLTAVLSVGALLLAAVLSVGAWRYKVLPGNAIIE
jgi:hypothetical protein